MKRQQGKKIAKLFYDLNLAFKNPSMRRSQVLKIHWDVSSGVFNPEVLLDEPMSVIDLAREKNDLIVKPDGPNWIRVSCWIESVEFFTLIQESDFHLYKDKLPVENS